MGFVRFAVVAAVLAGSGVMWGQAPAGEVARARDVLRGGLESKDWTIRVLAIQTAGLVGPNEPLRKKLEEFLADDNVQVRIAAIRTLADLKSTASIPAIEKRMREDDTPEVSFAAAKALYALHDPAGKQWLEDVYAGKQKADSSALNKQKRKFVGNFHSLESSGMFLVTTGIGYVPVPGVGEGFSAVNSLLADPDLSSRATSLLLLTQEKDAAATGMVKKGLTDDDWTVRAAAAQAIAFTARVELREDLVSLFTDKKEKVRFRAAGAYLHLALVEKQRAAGAGE